MLSTLKQQKDGKLPKVPRRDGNKKESSKYPVDVTCHDTQRSIKVDAIPSSEERQLSHYAWLSVQKSAIEREMKLLRDGVLASLKAGTPQPDTEAVILELSTSNRAGNSAAVILKAIMPHVSPAVEAIVSELQSDRYDCPEINVVPNPKYKGIK